MDNGASSRNIAVDYLRKESKTITIAIDDCVEQAAESGYYEAIESFRRQFAARKLESFIARE